MKPLEEKVTIITGSTSGIGLGTAKLFAKEGAKVIICGQRKKKGESIVEESRQTEEKSPAFILFSWNCKLLMPSSRPL